APILTASMHVEILHHFTEAKASVMVDDKLVLDDKLLLNNRRHPILRSLEMEHTASFEVLAGKHQVQVHVTTPDSTYNQTETLDTELTPGSKHILRVNCDKKKM